MLSTLKKSRGSIIILLFWSIASLATDQENGRARKILTEAVDRTRNASFVASNPALLPATSDVVLYHKVLPDKTILERYEHKSNGRTEIGIYNSDGYFLLMDKCDIAIKSPGQRWDNVATSFDGISYLPQVTFSMTDSTYMNIPCHKIMVKMPVDDNFLSEYYNAPLTDLRLNRDILIPTISCYLVGKESHFIYAGSWFNAQTGKPLGGGPQNWGKVEFKELSDDLFKLPSNVKIKKAEQWADVRKLQKKNISFHLPQNIDSGLS
ncbi:MAG: hypothetical protein PHQ27_07305 [Victivallales bacterium]|nr:hypothetical protein [Victivallales bacterium]